MFFGTKLDVDRNNSLTILMRGSERVILFSCKGKDITEEEITQAISNNKTAMTHIKIAARRGFVLFEEELFLVPVTLIVSPVLTPAPESAETEIWIPDNGTGSEAPLARHATHAGNPSAEQVNLLKSMHDMSSSTLTALIKSVSDSIARIAEAQSEGLRAMTLSLQQVQQSTERLGSLPTKIFESSNEKVEALVALAQQRAAAKNESPQPKDMLNELKELMGFMQTLKGAW